MAPEGRRQPVPKALPAGETSGLHEYAGTFVVIATDERFQVFAREICGAKDS